jgi:hypothetical protein
MLFSICRSVTVLHAQWTSSLFCCARMPEPAALVGRPCHAHSHYTCFVARNI